MAKTNKPNRDFRAEAMSRNDDLADAGLTGSVTRDDEASAGSGTGISQSAHTSAADQINRVAAATKSRTTEADSKTDRTTTQQAKMGNQPPANPPKR